MDKKPKHKEKYHICVDEDYPQYLAHCHFVICSVVGYTESQHLGDRNDCGAFPSCESRVFINTKPGKNPHLKALHYPVVYIYFDTDVTLFLFRGDRSLQDLTHMNLQLSLLTY